MVLYFMESSLTDGLSNSASRPNRSISSNFYQENLTRQLHRETSLSGQQIDHNQSDRPRNHVHEHDVFKFPITPYAHDGPPCVHRPRYALNELPHPHVVLAVGFFITNPEPCA